MGKETRKAIDVDEVDYEPEGTVELPVTKLRDGTPLAFRVRAVSEDELIPLLKGMPTGATGTGDRARIASEIFTYMQESRPTQAEIARLGVVEPPVSIEGPKPGHVDWNRLPFVDRAEVVNAIMALSGIASDQTKVVRSFRDGKPGGRAVRG